MNLLTAINRGIDGFVDFKGRATRSEYWYWVLFYVLADLTFSWLFNFTFVGTVFEGIVGETLDFLIPTFASVVLVIPSLAVSMRRLHDTGKSGWLLLLILVPIIGWIILIIFYCERGNPKQNRYGKPSKF